jgi:hypothetical protein
LSSLFKKIELFFSGMVLKIREIKYCLSLYFNSQSFYARGEIVLLLPNFFVPFGDKVMGGKKK